MPKKFVIVPYESKWESQWDAFVLNRSINGTFLQSRRFLNYHPADRFKDASLLILQGNEVVAVIPANCVCENGTKAFISHQGSTFGGPVINKNTLSINPLEELFAAFEEFILANGFSSVELKQPGRIYCKEKLDLLYYFFFNK